MTKTRKGKLLTVILALAICFTMVFSSLFTVNAATTYYTWSTGYINDYYDQATIEATFTAPDTLTENGIGALQFKLSMEEGFTLSAVDVVGGTIVGGAVADTSTMSASFRDLGNQTAAILATADYGADAGCTTIKVRFTFSCKTNPGSQHEVSISNLTISGFYDYDDIVTVTATGATGYIKSNCDHAYGFAGLSPTKTSTVDGYYVYDNTQCIYCGAYNPNKQYVPGKQLESTLYWDGTSKVEPTQKDNDGNILITTAAELAYVCSANAAAVDEDKRSVSGNYKIADGIKAIVLQPEATVNAAGGLEVLMGLQDYAQTKAYFEARTDWVKWAASGYEFKGTFDGNGVEIYGLYATGTDKNRTGLFGRVYIDYVDGAVVSSTIQNVAVKNAYCVADEFTGNTYASGALVGEVLCTPAYDEYAKANPNANSTGRITFDKCVVSGCYISSNRASDEGNLGVLIGKVNAYINITVKNTLVYGSHAAWKNTANNASVEKGIFGDGMANSHNGGNAYNITEFINCIIFDCLPYTTVSKTYAFKPTSFSACYNNYAVTFAPNSSYTADDYKANSRIIIVKKNDAKGNKAKETLNILNGWDRIWFVDQNGSYPTHSRSLLQQRTETWDGTVPDIDNPPKLAGSGTEADPYIISNAAELCAVTNGAYTTATADTYFKVADGIKAFSLNRALIGDKGISGWINEKTDVNTVYNTLSGAWTDRDGNKINNNFNLNTGLSFKGHFDGNGAVIYGLYSYEDANKGTANAVSALFPMVNGDVSIKNISVKKSYVSARARAGVIVGLSYRYSNSSAGSLTIENCSVVDAYVQNNWATCGMGAIFAESGNYAKNNDTHGQVLIKNCLVDIDNDCFVAKNNLTCRGGIGGFSETNNVKYENCIVMGITPYSTTGAANNSQQYTSYAASYTNVYTDTVVTNANVGGNKKYHTFSSVKKVAPSAIKGVAAVSKLPSAFWDTTNNWSYGGAEYPNPVPIKIASNTTANLDLLAANISYNPDGSFNLNFYYNPSPTGVKPTLYVGQADATGLTVLDGVTKLSGQSIDYPTAKMLGSNFKAGETLCYTINNIPARDIKSTFLPTAVAKIGKTTYYSKTESFSITDYAGKIINGDPNVVWNSSSSASQVAANKRVAAALVNYGTAAELALGTANQAVTKDIVDNWQANNTLDVNKIDTELGYATNGLVDISFRGTGTEADPIIISTAEQLVAVTRGHIESKGKYFKVSDDIKSFSLNQYLPKNNGVKAWIDENTPLDSIIKTHSGEWLHIDGKPHILNNFGRWSNTKPFEGHFDGNGVTIYGLLCENVDYAGLFPQVKGNVTIKNVNIKKAYISGYLSAGGIVGYSSGAIAGENANASVENSGSLFIHNCTVTDSYIENTFARIYQNQAQPITDVELQAQNGIGGIIGNSSNMTCNGDPEDPNTKFYNGDVRVQNCLVDINSEYFVLADGHGASGGIGAIARSSITKFTGCIVLGITPYSKTANPDCDLHVNHQWASYRGDMANYNKAIYTDVNVTDVYVGGQSGVNISADKTYTFKNITQKTREEMTGMSVMSVLTELDWRKGWVPNANGYPTPIQTNFADLDSADTTLTGTYLEEYNALQLDKYNNYGESTNALGLYVTSLSLTSDPYLALTFTFASDGTTNYKANRDKVAVTVTTDSDKTGITTNPPVFVNGEYISDVKDSTGVNGWTNKKNAGKYHMYDLKSIPVYQLHETIEVKIAYNGEQRVTSTVSLSGFANELLSTYNKTGNMYHFNCAAATKSLIYYAQALDTLRTAGSLA